MHAFEASPVSLEAFHESIEHNGFGSLVTVHTAPLGARRTSTCTARNVSSDGKRGYRGRVDESGDLRRGYASLKAHDPALGNCTSVVERQTGVALLPPGTRIGALRISANGWEGDVLEGLWPLIGRHPPAVIALEWSPEAMRRAGFGDPLALLQLLWDAGYNEISHSG